MAEPTILTLEVLAGGLFVEYLGSTDSDPDSLMVGLGYPPPVCDRLWHGHPGAIYEPAPQHVQVNWVGLEDAVVSFAVGFSCDDRGWFSGLGVISEAEYESRRLRVLSGLSPTGE